MTTEVDTAGAPAPADPPKDTAVLASPSDAAKPEPKVSWKGVYFNGRPVKNLLIWTKWDTMIDMNEHMHAIGAEHVDARMPDIVQAQHKEMFGNMSIMYADEAVSKEIEFEVLNKDAILRMKIVDLPRGLPANAA